MSSSCSSSNSSSSGLSANIGGYVSVSHKRSRAEEHDEKENSQAPSELLLQEEELVEPPPQREMTQIRSSFQEEIHCKPSAKLQKTTVSDTAKLPPAACFHLKKLTCN